MRTAAGKMICCAAALLMLAALPVSVDADRYEGSTEVTAHITDTTSSEQMPDGSSQQDDSQQDSSSKSSSSEKSRDSSTSAAPDKDGDDTPPTGDFPVFPSILLGAGLLLLRTVRRKERSLTGEHTE